MKTASPTRRQRRAEPQPNASPSRSTSRLPLERVSPIVLIGPAVALILLFRLIPLIQGAILSLEPDVGGGLGLDNYRDLIADPLFRKSLQNVVVLLVFLPLWVLLPMVLAILIHQRVPGWKFFRAAYFFPIVLSPVIIGSIFNLVLAVNGPLNELLGPLGIGPVDYLGGTTSALVSVVLVQVWSTFGLSVVIFMAGLSTIDPTLFEAAQIDGANLYQSIRYVIIPSLRRTIEFVAVVTMIGMLTSMFGLLFIMTGGGPGDSSYLPEFFIWIQQGELNRPNYASAASMVLFLLMGVIAFIQIRFVTRER